MNANNNNDDRIEIARKIYKYTLVSKSLPDDVEFVSFGSVYCYRGEETTENNNVYINKKCVGGFIRNPISPKSSKTVNLYVVEDLGDKIICRYKVVPVPKVYYLNGYSDAKVVEDIYIIEGDIQTSSDFMEAGMDLAFLDKKEN